MAGEGSLATTAIITKGLTCGHGPLDPCKTGLITSAFSLYCITTEPPPPPAITGGGSYPYDAWNKFNPGEIKNFYQPVPDEYYIVPREQEANYFRRYKIIRIGVKLGNHVMEKEYSVPEQKAKVIVKAFNVLDRTKQQITISVSRVKRIVSNITIAVKNMRLKK